MVTGIPLPAPVTPTAESAEKTVFRGAQDSPATPSEAESRKLESAAQEFESLLLAQVLRMARQSGPAGWLNSEPDEAASPTLELAESELAKAMAARGVLGIKEVLARSFRGDVPGAETQTEHTDRTKGPGFEPAR